MRNHDLGKLETFGTTKKLAFCRKETLLFSVLEILVISFTIFEISQSNLYKSASLSMKGEKVKKFLKRNCRRGFNKRVLRKFFFTFFFTGFYMFFFNKINMNNDRKQQDEL